ncbi:MAG: PTS sugar transporter subunit IIA [Mangrovicoccus sp.]
MELSSLLIPEAVKSIGGVTSKKRLLQTIGELAADCYGLDAESVFEALQDRESIGPTGVGDGVALPHARLDDLDHVKGVFVKIERPLDFEAIDRQPVDLVFALFAPADCGVAHLKALACVSRIMRNADTCAKLRANDKPETLFTILTELEKVKAA